MISLIKPLFFSAAGSYGDTYKSNGNSSFWHWELWFRKTLTFPTLRRDLKWIMEMFRPWPWIRISLIRCIMWSRICDNVSAKTYNVMRHTFFFLLKSRTFCLILKLDHTYSTTYTVVYRSTLLFTFRQGRPKCWCCSSIASEEDLDKNILKYRVLEDCFRWVLRWLISPILTRNDLT